MQLPSGATASSPYEGDGFNSAFNTLYQQLQGLHSDSGQAEQQAVTRLNQAGQEFSSLFTSSVGRAPTQDELNQFFSSQAGNLIATSDGGTGRSEADATNVNNQIQSYVSSSFQQQAKDYATQQLTAQQSQATDLANQYRTLGQQSIDSTAQYLQNYDQQLFTQLQPQIMQSLQAQGLLNTGGLNSALAGAQQDLVGQAQGYLADANLQMQNQANAIQMGGAEAPYLYQQSNTLNQLPYMQSQGQTALQNAYGTYTQQLQYQDQLGLLGAQYNYAENSQPSLMRSALQNFAGSYGTSAGGAMGSDMSPLSGLGKLGGGGQMAGGAMAAMA